MAKDWITTAEAAELIGVADKRIGVLARKHALEAKKDESYTGKGHKPFIVKRASVIAYRDQRKADMLDEPKVKAKPAKKATALVKADQPQAMRRARKPAGGGPTIVARLADEIGELREDLILLVRIVDRGWLSQDEAFDKLRELAESL